MFLDGRDSNRLRRAARQGDAGKLHEHEGRVTHREERTRRTDEHTRKYEWQN